MIRHQFSSMKENINIIKSEKVTPFLLKQYYTNNHLRETITLKENQYDFIEKKEEQIKIRITNTFPENSFIQKLKKPLSKREGGGY